MSKGRHTGTTNVYAKDIRRSILHAKKRFISIIVITLLGVMMFSGLQASCHDLRISADSFFDKQKLHDITVQSTLGLTEEDVKALSAVKGVKEAESVYSEEDDIQGMKDADARQTVEFVTLGDQGIDQPYIKKGRLPKKASEAAVTEEFSRTTGLKVGDTFQIAESSDSSDQSSNQTTDSSSAQTSIETSIQSSTQTSDQAAAQTSAQTSTDTTTQTSNQNIDQAAAQNSAQSSTVTTTQTSAHKESEFTITGIVIDPTRMDNPFSSVSYRKNANDKIRAFILENAVDSDIYTSINLRLTGAEKLLCYSTSYEDLTAKVVKRIEDQVMEDREQARTEEVRDQAVQSYQEALQQQMAAAGMGGVQADSSALQAIRDSIDPAVWYVQDRISLSGYSNIRSDADSIESIGTVFPVIFLAVAVLICLTTVARMVDEDRGLIGTYKSLGYTDREIRRKYIVFALLACLIGSIGGSFMAFVAFSKFIFSVFSIMYLLPTYRLGILPGFLISGPLLFFLGVTLSAELACRKQLKEVPAALMRPKAPKAGSRVLLERIPLFWKHMGFLSKVTARNLFRYKGRMLMTILGVGGCMALMLFGFSIRDSVNDLCPKQYQKIQRYGLLAVSSADQNDILCDEIKSDSEVRDWINIEFTSGKVKKDGQEETVQIVVVPDQVNDFSDYTALYALDGKKQKLSEGKIYLTENAATVLDLSEGSRLTLQLRDLSQAEIPITKIVKNYLTNYIYMTESTYEKYFDNYEANAIMAHFSTSCQGLKAQKAYGEELRKLESILSVQVVSESFDDFSGTFRLMNVIVSIVIVMSAALAFTVLFTLSAINMSERERELATIKVLGFYDREVHSYLNRETWVLTLIGILVGIPLGFAFAQTLGVILKLPGIFLEPELHFRSYLYAGGLTLIFAFLVQIMTNRSLDTIDPVTALKSAE